MVRLLSSRLGEPGPIPGRDTPGFSHVGNVSDYATGRQVFSGISRFHLSCIPTLFHTHLDSQDLNVYIRPNLSTPHLLKMGIHCGRCEHWNDRSAKTWTCFELVELHHSSATCRQLCLSRQWNILFKIGQDDFAQLGRGSVLPEILVIRSGHEAVMSEFRQHDQSTGWFGQEVVLIRPRACDGVAREYSGVLKAQGGPGPRCHNAQIRSPPVLGRLQMFSPPRRHSTSRHTAEVAIPKIRLTMQGAMCFIVMLSDSCCASGSAVIHFFRSLANHVRFPAGSLPEFRTWESCQMMPLVDGLTQGSPISFSSCVPALLHTHFVSPIIGSQDTNFSLQSTQI
ncbi:hypothetical protein PR048_033488 [Dryococelus australis]|uniref:Uncharacterized protein n=1 Tax=Dryococelus australis TaxID=614101 RepID=A0ABQ9G4K3_9NEOP|nr:hypothetical protein PR048_033488 [Dryococelus australis]